MSKQKTMYYIGILTILFSFMSCDNDDGDAVNEDMCNYQGLSFLDTNDNTNTLIPESDLFTDFFNTSSNGPEVEIYQRSNPGNFNFVTQVVTANGTGTGTLVLNGNSYTVNVICQRTGSATGEEMRYDVSAAGVEAEFCVIIDDFH